MSCCGCWLIAANSRVRQCQHIARSPQPVKYPVGRERVIKLDICDLVRQFAACVTGILVRTVDPSKFREFI